MGNVSPGLAGPVAFELAEPVEQVPGEHAMPGGSRYEMKWDGFRAGAVCRDGQVRLWSRNGKDFTAKFPEIQAALARQIGIDCVLDGELIVMVDGRSSFDALQLRNSSRAEVVRRELVPKAPALFMVFDLLAIDDVDIRVMRWTKRRARLEDLGAGWKAPLQLPPAFTDLEEAREFLDQATATGVEGLVVKGASTRYLPGKRGWAKWKTRHTVEGILGAVTGSLARPEALFVGQYRGKTLEVIGRTGELSAAQSATIGALLKPAGARHPWPDELSTHWGQRKTPIVKVRPKVVVEVLADTAKQGDRYRHPMRLLRYRSDMDPGDVEALPPA